MIVPSDKLRISHTLKRLSHIPLAFGGCQSGSPAAWRVALSETWTTELNRPTRASTVVETACLLHPRGRRHPARSDTTRVVERLGNLHSDYEGFRRVERSAGGAGLPKGTRSREGDRPVPRPLIAAEPARSTNMLQTLDRGVQVLTIVSQRADGISIAELAEELGVHRAIAYRLAATLEGHDLIRRSGSGQLRLGVGVLTLASRFQPQLRSLAAPLLRTLAATVNAAAFLSVAEGNDCVAVMVAEATNTFLRVSYRIGSRHGLEVGAAGIAILSGRAWSANERRGGDASSPQRLQPDARTTSARGHWNRQSHPGGGRYPAKL